MVGLRLNGALVPLLGGIQRASLRALFSPVWLRRTALTYEFETNQRLAQIPERLGSVFVLMDEAPSRDAAVRSNFFESASPCAGLSRSVV